MTGRTNPLAIIVVSLMLLAVSGRCFAGNLSGAVVVDTLKKADSPFIVTGNISVPSWHTLTIEPGVVLKFNLGLNFTIDGVLKAVGTQSDSIRFTSNEATPNLGDWNGVLFSSTGGGTLKYVAVEFAGSGVLVAGSAPSVQNSTFRMNSNGIDCMNSATPLLESNLFHDNSNTAIRCTDSSPSVRKNVIRNNVAVSSAILCQASSPLIAENVFRQNGSAAIDCLAGAAPQVWQNTIVQNDFGITIGDSSSPSIENNVISNNSNFGVAINDAAAAPVIKYNDVWANGTGDYFGTPPEVGALSTTNSNGDSSDVFMNISLDPKFADLAHGNVQLQVTSPCVDAGDPSNPAGVLKWGNAPDQGAFEFDGALPVELVSFTFADGLLKWTTASETDNFGFEVERSGAPEGDFMKVG
ncbi:MAG: right-handed parallel beta-helix repeat-containing protein, partial [Calditrichaeota bacterium]